MWACFGAFARLASVRRRYPFDALRGLRHERVSEQARVVAERVAESARALAREIEAEATRRSTERDILGLARSEQASLDHGLLRSGDLAAIAAWRGGADAQLEVKAQAARRARETRSNEVLAEAAARRALATADSEAQAIDRHQGAFRNAEAALEERADDEAAMDLWNARHVRPEQR